MIQWDLRPTYIHSLTGAAFPQSWCWTCTSPIPPRRFLLFQQFLYKLVILKVSWCSIQALLQFQAGEVTVLGLKLTIYLIQFKPYGTLLARKHVPAFPWHLLGHIPLSHDSVPRPYPELITNASRVLSLGCTPSHRCCNRACACLALTLSQALRTQSFHKPPNMAALARGWLRVSMKVPRSLTWIASPEFITLILLEGWLQSCRSC